MENLNKAWEANAEVWDNRMGDEGNDFFHLLCWTPLSAFLADETRLKTDLKADFHILDIVCRAVLTTRKSADMGHSVTAFDFSANLIKFAKQRSRNFQSLISFR